MQLCLYTHSAHMHVHTTDTHTQLITKHADRLGSNPSSLGARTGELCLNRVHRLRCSVTKLQIWQLRSCGHGNTEECFVKLQTTVE